MSCESLHRNMSVEGLPEVEVHNFFPDARAYSIEKDQKKLGLIIRLPQYKAKPEPTAPNIQHGNVTDPFEALIHENGVLFFENTENLCINFPGMKEFIEPKNTRTKGTFQDQTGNDARQNDVLHSDDDYINGVHFDQSMKSDRAHQTAFSLRTMADSHPRTQEIQALTNLPIHLWRDASRPIPVKKETQAIIKAISPPIPHLGLILREASQEISHDISLRVQYSPGSLAIFGWERHYHCLLQGVLKQPQSVYLASLSQE